MANDPLGISFSPASGEQQNSQKPTPVQTAIQTLSLRIPRVAGAGSLAPQQLLDAPGGGALGGNPNAANILEAIRRMLFGENSGMGGHGPTTALPPLPVGGGPGGSAPPPSVRPGDPAPRPPVTPAPPLPGEVGGKGLEPTTQPPSPPRLGPGVGPPERPGRPRQV